MPPLSEDEFDKILHETLNDEDGGDFVHDEEFDLVDDDDADDLALMREALNSYKAETLHFAEQQSSSMPVPRVHKAAALWDSTPRWAVAATAVLALGVTTAVATHRSSGLAPMAGAPAPTAQILHDDNSLLLSVDQALSASSAPSEADLGLTAAPAHSTKPLRATN